MYFIQLNLNHCVATQNLLLQMVQEENVDMAILSESYRNHEGKRAWTADLSGLAVVWVCGDRFIEEVQQSKEDGFVWTKVAGIYIYSVYAPRPCCPDFQLMCEDGKTQFSQATSMRGPLNGVVERPTKEERQYYKSFHRWTWL